MLVRVLIVKKILEKYLIKNLFVEIVFIWSLLPCCLFKIKLIIYFFCNFFK